MDTSDTGHDRCPSRIPDPSGAGNATSRQQRENKKMPFWFQEDGKNFLEPRPPDRGGRSLPTLSARAKLVVARQEREERISWPANYAFDPLMASITASVTSFVVALPPTSGV